MLKQGAAPRGLLCSHDRTFCSTHRAGVLPLLGYRRRRAPAALCGSVAVRRRKDVGQGAVRALQQVAVGGQQALVPYERGGHAQLPGARRLVEPERRVEVPAGQAAAVQRAPQRRILPHQPAAKRRAASPPALEVGQLS